jgi:signal transduction histidine kinase
MGLAIENCLFVEEFKKAQERIFSAEKLASIGGMAEGIAHQLVNRLNHFSLNAELIEHKIERFLGKEVSEVENIANIRTVFNDLSKIACTQTENVRHTHDMLKGILNYATIEVKEQDFCIFALEDIINPALELLKIKHNVNEFPLKIETGGDDGKIYGVKPQLMESLYNVLDNAYEALKEREALAKANGENYTPKIVLRKSVKNGMKVLEVVDNGIGIKDESKGKIFAPFFSTKSTNKSGSGIGMYIVKRMIEEIHKGKISLESEYGTGTAVRIELPGSNER